MKRILWIVTAAVAVSVTSVSCSRKVTRIDPGEQIDLSGRWNNTDSRLTAEKMIDDVLGDKWISDYQQSKNGAKPVVIVGFVTNKSTEHIDAETFVKDVEQSFIRSGKVRLVQGGKKREELRAEKADQQTNASASSMKKFGLEQGADFILQGSINSIVDAQKKKKVVYYQVNLELTNIQTNEVVWIGDKKIAKYVTN
ncbi:penicillin-binding protein activator LpoB [Paraflavitalea pollutisoli]|uniref:penicillin-binding protein activator LpoB n=1 Tax=Paraflavitalea pollutisoli TaxID=3034143 RepID=UPI0023EDB6FA|nr:penicillin-binding protein activator LpoB [Paraflavitalea sp. H1-2-19X]